MVEFVPAALLIDQAMLLAVRADLPTAGLDEFIVHLHANAANMQYASAGFGSPTHLACALLNSTLGVDVRHVPYRGGSPATRDLLGREGRLFLLQRRRRWESSIRSNQNAVVASRDYAAKNFPGTTFAQEPHAQDFMAYAYLQLGQDGEAKRIVGEVAAIHNYSGPRNYGRDTGEVAPAARYVLERAAWSEAAALPVRENAYTYAQAIRGSPAPWRPPASAIRRRRKARRLS